ncbi:MULTISPECIES: universal stress protein [Microbacterium]|uniref:universal stress protein n=1 Tax=Microbacterium TaxID=33882 RepID=UPI00217E7808|nr:MULTISPECIES: universal stress protein [Microbacterium]UWF77150.1 universal stress protein [Microbacterium neungamense]WCM55306.1 universal stress protein [Microbacterium sp. EF45047]
MTSSIVVGYTATDAGADALALGARLARGLGMALDLVIVLPAEGTRSAAVPPERAYEDHVRGQAQQWLRDAAASVPDDVAVTGHVRFGDSFAEGLIQAGEEFDARLIVVGAANGSAFGRHRLGSVASELVHSSPIPVALAPAGSARDTDVTTPISRVTAAVGTRAGADVLLEEAAALTTASGGSLRLISLVPFDVPAGLDTGTITLVQGAHGDDVLTQAREALPEGITAELERAAGESVEVAIAHLPWQPGEVLLVGSSRLAQPRRLFLGSTAAKMLHELPVPMIVVPRTRAAGEA